MERLGRRRLARAGERGRRRVVAWALSGDNDRDNAAAVRADDARHSNQMIHSTPNFRDKGNKNNKQKMTDF